MQLYGIVVQKKGVYMDYRRYLDYFSMSPIGAAQSFVIGLGVGIIALVLTRVLDSYVFSPLLCQPADAQYCTNVATYSMVSATIVAHAAGLLLLIKTGVLRPLLVVIAAVLTAWISLHWLDGTTWWIAMLYSGLVVGLSYLLYTWINRLSSFPTALGVTIVSVLAVRILLMAV